MAQFICKLGMPDGTLLVREQEAGDALQLREALISQGYRVFSVTRHKGGIWFGTVRFSRRISTQELLSLNQELFVLLKAGMPIMQLLDAILAHHTTTDGNLYHVLTQVREDVKGGVALSAALERQEGVFPSLYLASVRAGERTGDLPEIIRRYMAYLKRVDAVRKKVVSSLMYPAILVLVAISAISLLLVYVVPTFSQVYADAGSRLPYITRLLISFSTLLQNSLFIWLPLSVAAGAGLFRWSRSAAGHHRLDRMKLRLPLAGPIFFSYAVAGFARTMATLLGSGIPLVESLRMSAGTLDNKVLEHGMTLAVQRVEEGGRLTAALEAHHLMPPLPLRMLAVGENTGALEEMFTAIAEHLEEQIEERIRIVSTAVEPIIMIVMGLIIGFIIVAMYLPVFKLASTVGS